MGIGIAEIQFFQLSLDFSDISGKDDISKRRILNHYRVDFGGNKETWFTDLKLHW